VHIGIIVVPQQYAQDVCDKLVNAGVKGIWNFTSAILKVSDDIIVLNENLASSMAVLSNKLKEKFYK
jgi:redox-sensing transcriptional repressor